ncbi:MFS general substrate transporter [Setomelanomma holmii]|uniref:MFS general substrate transporter n=1 Tax=Setomelanomma holmii TaxID=210430 RepID=A0A9P4LN00_9PLEO|nr:MFS general substrate transporter [Setomelanomma holmii]
MGSKKTADVTAAASLVSEHVTDSRPNSAVLRDCINDHAKLSDSEPQITLDDKALPADPEAPKADPVAPLHTVFTRRQRLFICIMTTLASFFSPLSGQIYFPAIPDIAREYDTSIGHINLTITTYMILQGLAPTIMGTFGDTTGRRPAYIVTFTIYFVANIGLATQKSYAALLVLRCLQSAGSSGTIALGQGVISDIATSAERGKYLGPVVSGVMLAPAIGPTIGGLLAQYLEWRSIFWFLTIISGVYLVVYTLFMPETSRKVVGDGSIPPSNWWVMSPFQYWNTRQEKMAAIREGRGEEFEAKERKARELAKKRKFQYPNPLKSVMILREKDAAIIISSIAINTGVLLPTMASMTPLFGKVYGFNTFQVGLCYLPIGCAAIIAGVFNSRVMDWNYRRWAKKLNFPYERKRTTDLRNFPIEKSRLQPIFIFTPIVAICTISFGWVMQSHANLAVPLILGFIIGYAQVSTSNNLSSLLVDLFPEKASTVSAASNLVRCWLAGGLTAAVDPMLNGMGWGWCFTLFGGLLVLGLSLISVEYRKGMAWRGQRRVRKERKEEAKAGTEHKG